MASRDRLAEGVCFAWGKKESFGFSITKKKALSRYQRRFGDWRRVKVNRRFHGFFWHLELLHVDSSGIRVLSRGFN